MPVVVNLFIFFRIYLGSQIKKKKKKQANKQKELYFEKTIPLSAESFTGYGLSSCQNEKFLKIEGASCQEIL